MYWFKLHLTSSMSSLWLWLQFDIQPRGQSLCSQCSSSAVDSPNLPGSITAVMPSLSCDKAAFTASVTTLSCTWKLTQLNTESEDTRRNQRKTKKVWISPIDFWSQICRTKDTEDRVEEEKDFRGDLWMDMTRTWRWWQWQEHWESCTGATKVLCGSRRSVFYLWQPGRNNKLQKSSYYSNHVEQRLHSLHHFLFFTGLDFFQV